MPINQNASSAGGEKSCRTAAVLTISDRGSRGEREDLTGAQLIEHLHKRGFEVKFHGVVADEIKEICRKLREYADEKKVALILTNGGTGVAPRDVTPEATLQVVDRIVPGMAEAMRAASLSKTPHAMLSRAVVGIRGATLIIDLPGSPKGALENLEVLLSALPHALDKIQGDPSECAAPI